MSVRLDSKATAQREREEVAGETKALVSLATRSMGPVRWGYSMYVIERVCSAMRDQLISLVVQFAWDAESLRVAVLGDQLLVDIDGAADAGTRVRLAEKCGLEVSFVDRDDVRAGMSWTVLSPYSPEED